MGSVAIRFTQDGVPGVAGRMYVGAAGLPVTFENTDNADVAHYLWQMRDVPPGSAVAEGTLAAGAGVASGVFTPDLPGSYLVRLTATLTNQRKLRGELTFAVPEVNGLVLPPFGANDRNFNLGGSTKGWAVEQRRWLKAAGGGRRYDLLAGTRATTYANGTKAAVGRRPFTPRDLAADADPATRTVTLTVVLQTSDANEAAYFDLYDFSTHAQVPGSQLSTTSVEAATLTADLSAALGGVTTPRVLEGRIWTQTAGAFATCSVAYLDLVVR